jgi:hypothetical protein
LSIAEFLSCMHRAIREVMEGRGWTIAFNGDGFEKGQTAVSTYVRRQCELGTGPLLVSSACLVQSELELCFPKRAKVTIARFLRPAPVRPEAPSLPVGFRLGPRLPAGHVLPEPHEAAAASHVRVLPPFCLPGAVGGREPRTRSEHRLAAGLATTVPIPAGRICGSGSLYKKSLSLPGRVGESFVGWERGRSCKSGPSAADCGVSPAKWEASVCQANSSSPGRVHCGATGGIEKDSVRFLSSLRSGWDACMHACRGSR